MIARPEAWALEPLLEQLGLRQAAAVLPDWLDRAASQELSYADFLHGLLEEESVARANAATQKRLRQAGFPYAATIEQFDFRFRPELKRQVVLRYLAPLLNVKHNFPLMSIRTAALRRRSSMAASWMRRSLKERWRQAAEQYRARELSSGAGQIGHVGTLLTDEPSREVSRMGSAALVMLPR